MIVFRFMITVGSSKTGSFSRTGIFLAALLILGLGLRIGTVYFTRAQNPHPDMGSFFPSLLHPKTPFDTSPREPFYVWWIWTLNRLGIQSTAGIRAAGTLWFVPNLLLLFALGRRLRLPLATGIAAVLYTFLPGQIQGDAVGLRHLMETTGVLVLLHSLTVSPDLARRIVPASLAYATLTLTRITFFTSGGMILAESALRSRRWRPLLVAVPAAILLGLHLANNQKRTGDPLRSINLHTYWYANLEYVGRPGFPATQEERLKDVYRKSLTYREWAFQYHTPIEYIRDTIIGYSRFVWDFFSKVYFKTGVPAVVAWTLLGWHLLGLGAGFLTPTGRRILLWIFLLEFPYGFVGHIFWAGRFFIPMTPLTLLLMGNIWALGVKLFSKSPIQRQPSPALP